MEKIKSLFDVIGVIFSAIIISGYFFLVASMGACIGTMLLIVFSLKKRRRSK